MQLFLKKLLLICIVLSVNSCNPFAPSLDLEMVDQNKLLGDRTQIDGLFEWFKNSYELKDSAMYGQIIDQNFIFTFKDFTNSNFVNWDRGTEMQSTFNMFRRVKSANVQWNNYIDIDTTASDTIASVTRTFNLTIVQDDQNIYRGNGSARLLLTRKTPLDAWQIRSWYDNSDF